MRGQRIQLIRATAETGRSGRWDFTLRTLGRVPFSRQIQSQAMSFKSPMSSSREDLYLIGWHRRGAKASLN